MDPKPGRDGAAACSNSVPGALPALALSRKIQEKAATVGFDWTKPEPILAKLREETDEFEAAARTPDRDAQESELGDILFTVVNLARRYEIDPDAALRRTTAKFRSRFRRDGSAGGSRREDIGRHGPR